MVPGTKRLRRSLTLCDHSHIDDHIEGLLYDATVYFLAKIVLYPFFGILFIFSEKVVYFFLDLAFLQMNLKKEEVVTK
jgi:hypothetical protein